MNAMEPIYLDHAASCGERPPQVVEAVLAAFRSAAANPGRSAHARSLAAARLVYGAREALAELLHAPDSRQIAFTKNATEALNVVIHGLPLGRTVLVSGFEHNSVMRPLRQLESAGVLTIEVLAPARDSLVDCAALGRRLLRGDVTLVAVMAASNVSGQCAPLAEIGALCAAHGAFFLVDGAQGAGAMVLDVEAQQIDALALTGHKGLYGPQGTGALYLRDPERVEPLLQGGTGSHSELEQQPAFCPDRFEAGTLNVPGIAGLEAGLRFIEALGLPTLIEKIQRLRAMLWDGLAAVEGVRVLGDRGGVGVGVVSFVAEQASATELAAGLERRGVLLRAGLMCAPAAHRTLGSFASGGALRLSLSWFTSEEQIERALGHLRSELSR